MPVVPEVPVVLVVPAVAVAEAAQQPRFLEGFFPQEQAVRSPVILSQA